MRAEIFVSSRRSGRLPRGNFKLVTQSRTETTSHDTRFDSGDPGSTHRVSQCPGKRENAQVVSQGDCMEADCQRSCFQCSDCRQKYYGEISGM